MDRHPIAACDRQAAHQLPNCCGSRSSCRVSTELPDKPLRDDCCWFNVVVLPRKPASPGQPFLEMNGRAKKARFHVIPQTSLCRFRVGRLLGQG